MLTREQYLALMNEKTKAIQGMTRLVSELPVQSRSKGEIREHSRMLGMM